MARKTVKSEPGNVAGKRDDFSRSWITEKGREIIGAYSEGLTLRQLYYRLVTIGMTNSQQHYKRVVAAMTDARWSGEVDMGAFVDRERSVVGRTEADDTTLEAEIESTKDAIKGWMQRYVLERWSNQPKYVEVWIEKKAQQSIFETVCRNNRVALCPCKGYPSLTFLNEAADRFKKRQEEDKEVVVLYCGDHDPSGDDIPRSLQENLGRMGATVEVKRIALTDDQIAEYDLPGVPAKDTDSRTAGWSGGDVVEMDAMEPDTMKEIIDTEIKTHFDDDLYSELRDRQEREKAEYKTALKDYVVELAEGDGDE